jgi:hypothetical protein
VVENGLQHDLEGYWKFDNDALDSSGNGRDLTLTGAVPFVSGLIGQAADFPGANGNYYTVPHAGPFNIGNPNFPLWAISAWVNTDVLNVTQHAHIVSKKIAANDLTGWGLLVRTDGSVRFQQFPVGSFTSAAGLVTAGSGWQHILATSDGTTTRVYLDGVEVASGAALVTVGNSEPVYIGNRIDNDGRWVDGQVDEVAIWNRYLYPSEVAGIYNSGSGHELENALTPPSTPSISGNQITNFTPDNGVSLYSVILDIDAAGIDITEGEYGFIIPNFPV